MKLKKIKNKLKLGKQIQKSPGTVITAFNNINNKSV